MPIDTGDQKQINSAAEPAAGDLDGVIRQGHYASKQLFSKAGIISWSHRRRFQIGLELGRQFSGQRVLDYGCGDGTFLAMLLTSGSPPAMGVGSELLKPTVEECQSRLGGPNLRFVLVDELEDTGTFEGVFCMEVLEHIVEPDAILQRLERRLAPNGRLLISVPVEIGLPLIFKQIVRRVAGWFHIGDYPGIHPYTTAEIISGLFAGSRQHLQRPVVSNQWGLSFPDHKGFNWRAFRTILAQRFEIDRIVGSPLSWLPPQLGSQVWFILRKKPAAS
jgi:2-polyprenyl-3-methyl-5-hydroxy-6-metoxy-1,4-benzoquinol methylase